MNPPAPAGRGLGRGGRPFDPKILTEREHPLPNPPPQGGGDEVVDTVRTVIEAVRAGELDAAIEEAAGTRVGLKRTKSRASASA